MTTPKPPIEPMLAKVAAELPREPGFLFEPKWDGFRALVFRRPDDIHIQGLDLKPLNRYFPELEKALGEMLPKGCVLDGEIVVAGPHGLDFAALDKRIHASPSLISYLAKNTPASFVAFDLLAAGGKSTMGLAQAERRTRLERLLGKSKPPLRLTPVTRDREQAEQWLQQFKGAGLDGVMAKLDSAAYQPGKRAMLKVRHARSADCVVTGLRWYKDRPDAVGSLRLGLYDDSGALQPVGVVSAFTPEMRQHLVEELAPLRLDAAQDPDWVPLKPERVCEVTYDNLQGRHFRHDTVFLRWRPDKPPEACRFDQLEVATPLELAKMFKGIK